MALNPDLLAILACPQDKGPLHYLQDENKLYNPRLGWAYQIEDDIPVLLIERAEHLADAEKAHLDERVRSESIALTFSPDETGETGEPDETGAPGA